MGDYRTKDWIKTQGSGSIILDTLNRRASYLILLMKHSKIIIKKLIYNAQYV